MAFEYKLNGQYSTYNEAYYTLNGVHKKVAAAFLTVNGLHKQVFAASSGGGGNSGGGSEVSGYSLTLGLAENAQYPSSYDYSFVVYINGERREGELVFEGIAEGSSIGIYLNQHCDVYAWVDRWQTNLVAGTYEVFDDGHAVEFAMPAKDVYLKAVTMYEGGVAEDEQCYISLYDDSVDYYFEGYNPDIRGWVANFYEPHNQTVTISVAEVPDGNIMDPPYLTVEADGTKIDEVFGDFSITFNTSDYRYINVYLSNA